MSRLIQELAAAAASEKGLIFEENMVERLCAYSRAVAHFPTAVKEVYTHAFTILDFSLFQCVPVSVV